MQINRISTYNHGDYLYKNFTLLSDNELLMILEWRNHPNIRKYMNNTNCISVDSHLDYCHNLINRSDVCYWLIYKHNEPIGVLNIIDIDYEHESCEPGFYLSPKVMGRGESIFLLSNYKDMLINKLGFKSLIGHNYIDNNAALLFTMFFGAKIVDIQEINHRTSVKSLLTKECFINGEGTPKLITKYAKFCREWSIDKELAKYEKY